MQIDSGTHTQITRLKKDEEPTHNCRNMRRTKTVGKMGKTNLRSRKTTYPTARRTQGIRGAKTMAEAEAEKEGGKIKRK